MSQSPKANKRRRKGELKNARSKRMNKGRKKEKKKKKKNHIDNTKKKGGKTARRTRAHQSNART